MTWKKKFLSLRTVYNNLLALRIHMKKLLLLSLFSICICPIFVSAETPNESIEQKLTDLINRTAQLLEKDNATIAVKLNKNKCKIEFSRCEAEKKTYVALVAKIKHVKQNTNN